MSEKNVKTSELTNDGALIVLFLYECMQSEQMWNDYVREVNENSRFFPKTSLLDRILELKNDATYYLQKGEAYYRARVFEKSFLEADKRKYNELSNIIRQHFPEFKANTEELFNAITDLSYTLNMDFYNDVISFLRKRKKFWGYLPKDSDAPSSNKASNGRANSEGISFLYIADSEKTAIMEVRPRIQQYVSVAKIVLEKQLKVFDLCKEGKEISGEKFLFYDILSREFSKPYSGSDQDYYPTQYLSEFIRDIGFDGIRFNSLLVSNHKNIVLFDTAPDKNTGRKNYSIRNTKVFVVNEYLPDIRQIAPWVDTDNGVI